MNSRTAPQPRQPAAAPLASAETGLLAREVLAQLAELQAALGQLAALAAQKLGALRRADAAELQQLAAREGAALTELFRREPVRKANLARLAQALRCAEPQRPSLTVIAECLPEPLGSTLRARAAALAAAARELQQKNRLAATVARNLHGHVRGIFASIAGAERPAVYGPPGNARRGAAAGGVGRRWVDAVG